MAKRKKNRAKPAAGSQPNVADAEVRPETEGEVPAGEAEVTDTAQAEAAVEAQTEEVSEAQPESTGEPSGEASPEDGEAAAERGEDAPVSEATEVSAEDTGDAAEEGSAEEAAAEAAEGVAEEKAEAAAEEGSAEEGAEAAAEEGAAEEAAAEEGVVEEEAAAAEEAAAEECVAEESAAAAEEAAAEEGVAEESAAAAEEAAAEEGVAEESAAAAEEGVAEEEAAAAEATDEPVSAAEAEAQAVWAEDRVTAPEGETAPAEASEQDPSVWTESAEGAEGAPAGEGEAAPTGEDGEEGPILDSTLMESVIEGLLFASDRVLGMADFKRLLEERDGKKIAAALDSLTERRKGTGIEVVHLSNGWHLRTNSEHARWVSKLLAGKPMRLSRAMMETLAIVAYRQPVTRPEIDEIRGVDCGPVLKTLLDRGLVRVIGKKEDVGRPMLYGTTPEFLRVFNLRELSELPTLREYAELNSEQQAVVDAKHGPGPDAPATPAAAPAEGQAEGGEGAAPAPGVDVSAGPQLKFVPRGQLPDEPDDSDPLLDELDAATKDASKILGAANEPPPEAPAEAEASAPAPAGPSHET
jgi:segregation and condensation protein B